MPTIDEVWRTNAGAQLFNGITRMHLVDGEGQAVLFSKRLRLTEQVIGLLLEVGCLPEDMTQRLVTENSDSA